ncbi:hypothetical protein UFOVP1304_53 [uncultured Caudovirales phage]|uniref:Uncharacterized protein n=1 Tax=uncultured Caudovirales phage TaxID=2100421 RepID=A0A6J5RJI0_9CAUD|nr:hypothetical protein UFOVP1304_53 [uncultured Caudovirales phage]
MRKPVLSFTNGSSSVDVYLLNVGEVFEGFGGSKSGLCVHKTASLITRHNQPGFCQDREWDLAHEGGWKWIRSLTTQYGWEISEDKA